MKVEDEFHPPLIRDRLIHLLRRGHERAKESPEREREYYRFVCVFSIYLSRFNSKEIQVSFSLSLSSLVGMMGVSLLLIRILGRPSHLLEVFLDERVARTSRDDAR